MQLSSSLYLFIDKPIHLSSFHLFVPYQHTLQIGQPIETGWHIFASVNQVIIVQVIVCDLVGAKPLQVIAWWWIGDKLLPEPMLTEIYDTI